MFIMASSAEARGSLLQAAGVEDEEESTAPLGAVRVSLPSREGGSLAAESAPIHRKFTGNLPEIGINLGG